MCLALLTCAFSVRPPKPSLGIPYQTDWRFCCCCCCFLFFFCSRSTTFNLRPFYLQKKIFLYLRGHRPTVRPRELSKFHSLLHQDPCAIPVNPFMGNDSRITSYGKRMGQQKKKETRETRCYPPAHPEHFLNHPLPIFRVPSDVSIDRVVIVQNDYSVVSRFPVSVPPFSGR